MRSDVPHYGKHLALVMAPTRLVVHYNTDGLLSRAEHMSGADYV